MSEILNGGLGNFATIDDGSGGLMGISEDAYKSMVAAGNDSMATVMNPTDNTTFGIDNNIFDLGLGLGQLGLGYLAYKDNKELNKAKIAGMNQNLENAKTEAAATAAYRKSYGA